ncbi:MAG: PorT family protein [Cyclobacteriaceae bacterium]|nr:PorT family protein [Cyclobacteriaceae bacterium]
MKRTVILFSVLLVASGMAYSQAKLHVGASTTVNATFILDEGLNTNPQYVKVTSVNYAPIGMSFGVDFNNSFGLQVESILTFYEQAYNIYETLNNTQIGELKFDLQYLHFPVLFKFMSDNNNKARAHFLVGPQLSYLLQGQETLRLFQSAANQNLAVPDLVSLGAGDTELPVGTVQNADGSFLLPGTIPQDFQSDLLVKNASDQINAFRNQEIHIVTGFGVDIDLTKDIYLSMLVKADYGFTDMRNGDLIDGLKNSAQSTIQELYKKRANLAIGAQISVSYMFGGTRSFLR